MTAPTIEQKAQQVADSLGISVYLSPKGRITQNNEDGVSREIRPHESAKARPHVVEEVELLKGAPPAGSVSV